jgi:hypothetical protein
MMLALLVDAKQRRYMMRNKRMQKSKKPRNSEALKMVHPGGFEPPTARFVAEYSIQLS